MAVQFPVPPASFSTFVFHLLRVSCFVLCPIFNWVFFLMSSFMLLLEVVFCLLMLFVSCCSLYIASHTHTVSLLSWFHSLEVALLELSHSSSISSISPSPTQPGLTFTAFHTGLGIPSLLQVAWPQRLSETMKEESTTPPLLRLSCSKAGISWMALAP